MLNPQPTIPESLQQPIAAFLELRPDWDIDRLLESALSLFLLQNVGVHDRAVARVYLDSLFTRPIEPKP